MPKFEVNRGDAIKDFNQWRADNNLPKARQGFKKRIRTFSVSNEAYAGLQFIAQLHGVYYGGVISISALIESIGLFDYLVVDPDKNKQIELENKLKAYNNGESE